jgi:DNA ligase-1
VITYGTAEGKQQEARKEYTVGKNIGKSNETTPHQQCMLETERKWKDKKKEGYSESCVSDIPATILPMLAQPYKKEKRNGIVYPCMVQPKLDGLRCIMYKKEGKVVAQSRTGGIFELSYLTESLDQLDTILDGELYTKEIPFETLSGLIKKKTRSESEHQLLQRYLRYHVYDIVSDQPFSKRYEWIKEQAWNPYITVVPTFIVSNEKEWKTYFSAFVEDGLEGIMLRNTNGLYQKGYRSHDLQKYKEFQEEEYPIVGWEQGEAREEGCVIWICATDGKEFRVRPRGSLEQRREWYKHAHQYLGKQLTVIFQELSEQGIPRFPVGKSIREHE